MRRQFVKTSAGVLLAFGVLAGCSLQQAATPQAGPTQPAGYEEHNDADVAFAQQMIPLEQRAVAMSEALLAKPGVDRDVSDIARAIHENDRPEVVQLQQWLKDWGAAAPGAAEQASGTHAAAIQDAEPVQAARLYLEQMIANHERTLALSKTEVDKGTYRATVAVAGGGEATLERQITTMKTLLGSP
ncbi:DUF305 domain-containing protein [Mycolicibacterium rhodesiae]|uniref:DUF305 domain-containing protein n=1 Tax=Mycolicibacterium rhodesiae TaxID=36814 RepID=A0A1X0J747_MYCRH|nr:DUF305 domain-containing protein [Mycolicibacterium rhodesiae]MCV7347915.1 DUF305 domain-containing protein [Mycolicibacterium rhodesiae]ORB57596.1 hypothetical protein BST42_02460 [Mycolicibacterium rhodesiae]